MLNEQLFGTSQWLLVTTKRENIATRPSIVLLYQCLENVRSYSRHMLLYCVMCRTEILVTIKEADNRQSCRSWSNHIFSIKDNEFVFFKTMLLTQLYILYVRVVSFLAYGKHWHDHILLLRIHAQASRTSLTSPLYLDLG